MSETNSNANMSALFARTFNYEMDTSILGDIKKIKGKIDLMKHNYALIVMELLKSLGMDHEEKLIKATGKIDDDLSNIVTNLNILKQQFQEIEGLSFPKGKHKSTPHDDPAGWNDTKNITHMHDVIYKWIHGTYDKKSGTKNYEEMQNVWKKLFVTVAKGKTINGKTYTEAGLVGKLDEDIKALRQIEKPGDPQDSGSQQVIDLLKNLDSSHLLGSSGDWKWSYTDKTGVNRTYTLIDFLNGVHPVNVDTKGQQLSSSVILEHIAPVAYCHSYYHRTSTQPEKDSQGGYVPSGSSRTPSTQSFSDSIGDVNNTVETSKQTVNTQNQTQQAHLSFDFETMASYDKAGQSMVTNYFEGIRAFNNNVPR